MSNLESSAKLKALIINCTLKPSPDESSSEVMGGQVAAFLSERGVTVDSFRAVDHVILPGVEKDMGEGDEWPALREKVLAADILVLLTPTWMGQQSSVAQRVLERLDAELGETDADGRPILFDKVAVAVRSVSGCRHADDDGDTRPADHDREHSECEGEARVGHRSSVTVPLECAGSAPVAPARGGPQAGGRDDAGNAAESPPSTPERLWQDPHRDQRADTEGEASAAPPELGALRLQAGVEQRRHRGLVSAAGSRGRRGRRRP